VVAGLNLTVHILAAVAEHEAAMISQRTRAALAAAKARGKKLGGNRGNIAAVRGLGNQASAIVRKKRADKRAGDLMPVIRSIQVGGASLRQVADELTRRGIMAARECPALVASGLIDQS
jgi:DNA invertase Pin-like site-specific DNA recombinase